MFLHISLGAVKLLDRDESGVALLRQIVANSREIRDGVPSLRLSIALVGLLIGDCSGRGVPQTRNDRLAARRTLHPSR